MKKRTQPPTSILHNKILVLTEIMKNLTALLGDASIAQKTIIKSAANSIQPFIIKATEDELTKLLVVVIQVAEKIVDNEITVDHFMELLQHIMNEFRPNG